MIYGKCYIDICNNFIQDYSKPRTFTFFAYVLKEPSSTSVGLTAIVTLLAVPSDGRANVGILLQLHYCIYYHMQQIITHLFKLITLPTCFGIYIKNIVLRGTFWGND
jgi:hypothetical protein